MPEAPPAIHHVSERWLLLLWRFSDQQLEGSVSCSLLQVPCSGATRRAHHHHRRGHRAGRRLCHGHRSPALQQRHPGKRHHADQTEPSVWSPSTATCPLCLCPTAAPLPTHPAPSPAGAAPVPQLTSTQQADVPGCPGAE